MAANAFRTWGVPASRRSARPAHRPAPVGASRRAPGRRCGHSLPGRPGGVPIRRRAESAPRLRRRRLGRPFQKSGGGMLVYNSRLSHWRLFVDPPITSNLPHRRRSANILHHSKAAFCAVRTAPAPESRGGRTGPGPGRSGTLCGLAATLAGAAGGRRPRQKPRASADDPHGAGRLPVSLLKKLPHAGIFELGCATLLECSGA